MILYVSGPMRGYPSFNFPVFDHAAHVLSEDHHTVFNPVEHDRMLYPDIESWEGFVTGDTALCPKFNLPTSLAWDFQSILRSDGIVLLKGWESSSGARAERFVAEVVGKQVWIINLYGTMRYWLELDNPGRMEYPRLGDQR